VSVAELTYSGVAGVWMLLVIIVKTTSTALKVTLGWLVLRESIPRMVAAVVALKLNSKQW
jgi:hypothetical protein